MLRRRGKGKVCENVPSVSNGTRHALSYQDAVTLGEVAGSTSVASLAVLATASGLLVLHGVDAAHTTVGLDQFALSGNKRGTRRLGGTGQETTHHDSGGTKGKTLDDVAHVLDTTISNARNTESRSERADVEDGGGLGSADGHDLLCNAGRAAAHTDTQTIDTGSNQAGGLLARHNVSANDVEAGELLLDPLDHLDLVHGVTLRAVENDNVKAGIDELLQADLVFGASADGSRADELLGVGELGGEGEVQVLAEIGARDHGHQVAVLVDNGQLALLGLGQNCVGLLEGDAVGGSDEVCHHDVGDRLFEIVLELEITVGNDTKELGVELAGLCKCTKSVMIVSHE